MAEPSTPPNPLGRLRDRSRRWRIFAAALVALIGAVATALVLREEAPPPPSEIFVPVLHVAGHPLPGGGDPVGQALDLVRRYAIADVKLKLPDGRTIAASRADFGLEIDRLRLTRFVNEALQPGSALARAHAARAPGEPLEVPLPITIDGEKALAKLVDLKAQVDKPPADAVIDLEARKIKPEQLGYQLDVYGTLARLESAFRSGRTEIEVDAQRAPPKRVAAQLDGVRFDAVLGWFETRYSTAKKDQHRTYNLRLAASKLDGIVLMPGEVFDFNGVVGPRDEANGFRVAPVIAQGELVDGIGGGTCQISGTLHAAAFFAGLEIVERYPHSRPSSYIKLGLDATVSYPNINYRFKNPFDFPVVLHEKVAGGVVRAEILGPERKLTVSYFRRIDEILPFEETVRETEKLAAGERVVVQRGIPGFVATASRVVRDGAYAERTKWREKYPPTTQIVMLGTAEGEVKPGFKQDTHGEYTVDEYLVLTQGVGIRGDRPGGGMVEERTAGRTGEEGWIRALGLEKTPLEEPEEEGDKAKGKGDKKNDKRGDKKDDKKDDKRARKKGKVSQ